MTFSTEVTPTRESERCTVGRAAWTSGVAARVVIQWTVAAGALASGATLVLSPGVRNAAAQKGLKVKAWTVETGPQMNGVLERTGLQDAKTSDACLRRER